VSADGQSDPSNSPSPASEAAQPTAATAARQLESTLRLSQARPATQGFVRRFQLRVLDGPDAGAVCHSSGDRVTIGTHESANLVLHDRTVSRLHCEISFSSERPFILDLGSLNGTLVDGTSILSGYLQGGAVLTVGETRLAFEFGEGDVPISLSAQHRFGSLAGQSVAMRAVFALLERASSSNATVLLEGETGTGKEAAAESIHRQSERRDAPFIVVDCGAIPPNLIESELFGHARGAFTGAVGARVGAFEAASGGTLFLDEVGELELELQPKLLRALERREIKRVGETKYLPTDARVIAATNQNLAARVNAGQFRSDLYYRLAVLEIRLPPLRERVQDLPLLLEHFLEALGAAQLPQAARLRSAEFQAALRRHTWPGNVRELRNYIERCLTMGEEAPRPALIETASTGSAGGLQPFRNARDAFEKGYLEQLLRWHEDNVTAAAKAAGLDRGTLYRMLWRHQLR